MGCKNLECFEFSKLSFLIFKNNVQILNILLLFLELIFKIKNDVLENSKHSKFLPPQGFHMKILMSI
jgi:hypothetical protein